MPVVVVLDDDRAILSSLQRALRAEPYELFLTDQPEMAFERVRQGDVGLIMTDYRMPAMDGIEVLHGARAISPGLSAILLTGHPGETIVFKGLRLGEFTIVNKPWDNDKLKTVVRSLLGGRTTLGALRDGMS